MDGLRSLLKKDQRGLASLLYVHSPDVLCLQETKIQVKHEAQLAQQLLELGYVAYWSTCISKKGYAGTAILFKKSFLEMHSDTKSPLHFISIVNDVSDEGRLIAAEFQDFYLVNVYSPNSGNKLAKLDFRVNQFDKFLFSYLDKLNEVKPVIMMGDLNVAHLDLDMWHDPSKFSIAGVSKVERDSFDSWLQSSKFTDAFRFFNPNEDALYSNWMRGSNNRELNRGYRFDHVVCSDDLVSLGKRSSVQACYSFLLPDDTGKSSDHCPIALSIEILALVSEAASISQQATVGTEQAPAFAFKTEDESWKLETSPFEATMRRTLYELVPRSKNKSIVTRQCIVSNGSKQIEIDKMVCDSGADMGNYIGRSIVDKFPDLQREPCRHSARLADGVTVTQIKERVTLYISPVDDYGDILQPIATEFFVIDHLGDEILIGLPDLLGNYYEYFSNILARGARNKAKKIPAATSIVEELDSICSKFEDELYKRNPNMKKINGLVKSARRKLLGYSVVKTKVVKDSSTKTLIVNDKDTGKSTSLLVSPNFGTVFEDDRPEMIVEAMQLCAENVLDPLPGELLNPWRNEPEECPEDLEAPDPLAFGEDVLRFMEMSVEESQQEYFRDLESHIDKGWLKHSKAVIDLLSKPSSVECFAPSSWNGLKMEPVKLETVGQLPYRLSPKPRPVRESLYQHAKKEFERLKTYFYEESNSPIASPLVIAPKATAPFIRFCGDYREVNKFIKIPQQPIPIVQHELVKAAKFKVFVDLDMANSFHQIPLSPEFSDLLSVKTPWGLVRPKFLPEGVGPASGLLQHIVRDAFNGFEDWTIVIFDNFLILADDYDDAYAKLERVLKRCNEFGIILKLKKSWMGVDKVTFFGYEVQHGTWQLSDTRKTAISAMEFPKNTKQMQSFLGAALFFHHHIPNYSEWTARLYEMTHENFVWKPGEWTFDYEGEFNKFKKVLMDATLLYFPDYSLPWIIRCDASDHAVGSVLYQEKPDGVHQPIAFSSKRFSAPAKNWDTYKREAYAIYHAVSSFSYYLRGKDFIVESDHKNLQWIESSQSPIVVRWRTLLQSYDFLVRHIPGKENKVADWMSRMYRLQDPPEQPPATTPATSPTIPTQPSFDALMKTVHSGKHFHFGAYETWKRAKEKYPDASIPITQVRDWVKTCPMCQKMRDTGIEGLPSTTRTLKPSTYRRAVGIDHVSVTPTDRNGNCCAVVITEHFSHFVQVYPARDYSADSVVSILIKHYTTFGLFDELVSDPGSAFMSKTVATLNELFNVRHKVSLIGRHESNGVEGSIKQFLRHLKTYVFDERLVDRWSDSNIISLINFTLNNRQTPETGSYTPFQLKFGTQDAEHFKLPLDISPGAKNTERIKQLDEDLRLIRELSVRAQQEVVEHRKAKDAPAAHYEPGDLVLWNPREQPTDHLVSKLSPTWLGPYKVLAQRNNDVRVEHIVMKTLDTFHMDRLKPFFGSMAEAIALAKLDNNQYDIASINYFTGNPHLRTSMSFNVTFNLGHALETLDIPYNNDLACAQQFIDFVAHMPYLFPLTSTADRARRLINKKKAEPMPPLLNFKRLLNLRYFDGQDRQWFDNLNLPDKSKTYFVEISFLNFYKADRLKAKFKCQTFNDIYTLTSYDYFSCTLSLDAFNPNTMIRITAESHIDYPQLFQQ